MTRRNYIMCKVGYNENYKSLLQSVFNEGFKYIMLEFTDANLIFRFHKESNRDNSRIYTQLTIHQTKKAKIMDIIRKYRHNYDIIAISSQNREILSFGIRDNRIDSIIINKENIKLFNQTHFKHIKNNNKIVEIELSDLLNTFGMRRVKLLNKLKRVTHFVLKYDLKLILSIRPKDDIDLRTPQEIVSIAHFIDLPRDIAVTSISKVPLERIKLNLEKRKDTFIMPGVKVVKWGSKK